jgi:ERO1-like protein alpha
LLYQLVSGMHASVNMHVSTHYQGSKGNETYPNHSLYYRNLGAHPERIKNMYFLYAAVLRAINRAEPILRSY